jgi:hypothetical protein
MPHDANAQRVFIKHEPNVPPGGQLSEIEIGTFLSHRPLNPEHQALLRLIASLVNDQGDRQTINV